jgi:hypothetical protein
MRSNLVFGFEARFAMLDWGGKKERSDSHCRSTDAAWPKTMVDRLSTLC